MYSPTLRVLAVLALLQAHHRISGAEIAHRLEVDTRTVRRYIATLQDMGIPVESERGAHGAYFLGRGAQMPPLIFTDSEAVALALGLIAVKRLRFPVHAEDIEGALAKVERALPLPLLQLVRSLQDAITMHGFALEGPTPQSEIVAALSQAIRNRHQVHFAYRAFSGDVSSRDFDPYGIVFLEGFWYTSGYCHLRRDLRTFRLDRILDLAELETPFVMPDAFDATGHVQRSIGATPTDNPVRILLKTTHAEATVAIPNTWGTLEKVSIGVIFRPSPFVKEWIGSLLLHLDFPLEILEPDSLRAEMARLATRAQEIAKA